MEHTNYEGETETYTEYYDQDYEKTEQMMWQEEPCFEFIDGSPKLPGNTRYQFAFVIPKETLESKRLRPFNESAELDIKFFLVC